jgi:hypothetical protein
MKTDSCLAEGAFLVECALEAVSFGEKGLSAGRFLAD